MRFFPKDKSWMGTFIKTSFAFLLHNVSAQDTGGGGGGFFPAPNADEKTQNIVIGVLVGLGVLACCVYALKDSCCPNEARELNPRTPLINV